ncbi:Pseudouridine-5'-phosphate glycosidase [Ostreococcus tauri]|uniref:Pseudouridine-5'-phosphate glycosidase n=1 Tax=Ostreococcus tauri TaxID=70448 RepID=A0A090M342_OSTTA|nr:Pseudouridine-5'-phosphate glycosidase [Ostreococcus tauri]CEF98655.1 Pseudouridine-5'-phosphate glycosidase [Ostreococcus tauri]|eukprot:XP_022839397.1 Pseudouridine-5'-phosphate glycosidase [Ostreococcus tauri]
MSMRDAERAAARRVRALGSAMRASSANARASVVVFGGTCVDAHARAGRAGALKRGTSAIGRAWSALGGVGMNVATACASASARTSTRLVSAVGDDADGDAALEEWSRRARGGGDDGVRIVKGGRTARVVAVLDGDGEIAACVADVEIVEEGVDSAWCASQANACRDARGMVLDGNLGQEAIETVKEMARKFNKWLWYEPVSVEKSTRILGGGVDDAARPLRGVTFCSPNAAELRELANGVRRGWAKGSPMSPCPFNPEFKFKNASEALDALASDVCTVLAAGCEHVVLTLGPLGVVVSSAPSDGEVSRATHTHVPAVRADVVSLVGAGDALVGGAVGALAEGASLLIAIARGVACASIACERAGAALLDVDANEMEKRAAIAFAGISILAPAVR